MKSEVVCVFREEVKCYLNDKICICPLAPGKINYKITMDIFLGN